MTTRTEHIETLRGRGFLVEDRRTRRVPYLIRVFQEYVDDVPTVRTATGRLRGVGQGDAALAMLSVEPLELKLENGQSAKVLLENLHGDFIVTGIVQTSF